MQDNLMKTFKEYIGRMTRGYAIGGVDQAHPIASLGDVPPKGKGSRSYRAVGLTAQKNPRIPRKPGQKAGSDKHSDLYMIDKLYVLKQGLFSFLDPLLSGLLLSLFATLQ